MAGVLCLLGGCDDPLAAADYRGAPIFKVDGQVLARAPLPRRLADADFRVSIFWAPSDERADPKPVEQPSITANLRFPSFFELRVFEPPTDAHLGSPEDAWGIGLVLIYADIDGDGDYRRRAGDEFVGGNVARGLIYARTELDAADSPNGEALPAGFSLVDLPLNEPCDRLPIKLAAGQSPRRPRPSCGGGCQPGFRCDRGEDVCIPDEVFNLETKGDFKLSQTICPRE